MSQYNFVSDVILGENSYGFARQNVSSVVIIFLDNPKRSITILIE